MSSTISRVLLVTAPGTALPAIAPASAFGPFELSVSADLDDAAARLAAERFDAIVIAARTVDARKLLSWPALTQAASEPALLVLTTDEPGAELATLLVRKGVQDVLPLSIDAIDALPRAIRLAIERKSQERLARKANATDLMTGLPNQGQLLEHVNQLIALREREPAPMALVAVRVEGLAQAEAQLGAESANVLRRKIAVRLRVGVRASDVVASLGSDAFAVLLPRVQDPQDAGAVAAKLCAALKPPFAIAGGQTAVAVACGVAHYPADGKDAAALLRRASGLAASAPAEGRQQATEAANDPQDE
ncbi:MAG TPA: GGDEF domain-containing protein [Albitalea sp.]|uniref:GGDEF domain-containing protein n=1 Tax=Piscinibacter sp. TaxID=1903157 RepID=UPI002ED1C26B